MLDINNFYKNTYKISEKILKITNEAEIEVEKNSENAKKICEYNSLKVLKAFNENKVCEAHFYPSTGYGYDDNGRETLDKVYASVFGAEDAIVRHSIVNGTQAISLCFYGILRPNDTVIAATGRPYDTLEEVIGLRGESGNGSLADFGVKYKEIPLKNDKIDIDLLVKSIDKSCKMVAFQRSKGYSWRNSLSVDEIGEAIAAVKAVNKDIVCFVDNCYGEFVEAKEPCEVGADLIAGSLIKNPGGGICRCGGYIAGTKKCIELISYRLTCPGIGRECGASLGENRFMYQGLFLAPHIVFQSIKAAMLVSSVFEKLGYEVMPKINSYRTDIIQAVKLGSREKLVKFCQGIQKGAPIDSFVVPEAWDMPGYDSQVVMAAGAFTQGSSIEISADGPIREPYIAFYQGGLTYETAKAAIMAAAENVKNCK